MNRPAEGLAFDTLLEGLMLFAGQYKGKLRTETLLCNGINDTRENLRGVASIITAMKAGKANISIPIRPPAEKGVMPPGVKTVNIA